MPEETPVQLPPIAALPPIVTPDALKIALLENNNVINASIAASGEKITQAVNNKMDSFIGAVTELKGDQTKLEGEFTAFKNAINVRLQGIWGKVILIAGGASAVFGIIGYFIGAGHFIAK